jgi:XRE family transcriptional regulator, fatty acid utilization regulator
MNSSKLFAGSRLRRLRLKLGQSQSGFAQTLGISASYLNLMERDQRPVTAQVVLKLSQMKDVDIAELGNAEHNHSALPALREMLADPLLANALPPGNELHEALAVAPNFAGATLKLYEAYREVLKRLADAAQGLAPQAMHKSFDQWLEKISAEPLEALAEDVWSMLSPKDDIFAGLKSRLRTEYGIDTRILPSHILGVDRSHYDRHSQRLLISENLNHEEKVFEAAQLLAQSEGRMVIENILAQSPLAENPEERRLAKASLLNHLALAVISPRAKFSTSAEDLKCDVAALSRRFTISQAHAMQRLAMLNTDLGFLCVEANGQIAQRFGDLHYFIGHNAPLCGQLPLFDAGETLVAAQMQQADNSGPVVLAFRHKGKSNGLFFSKTEFEKTIYAKPVATRALGSTCRLCEIRGCSKRTAASALRPTAGSEFIRGPTPFEPV